VPCYSGLGVSSRLCWVAQAAISVLEASPSLRRIFEMCLLMVCSERKSSWATGGWTSLVRP
jgi:hypothetical protein